MLYLEIQETLNEFKNKQQVSRLRKIARDRAILLRSK